MMGLALPGSAVRIADNTLSVNVTRHPLRNELLLGRGQPCHCGSPGELAAPTGAGITIEPGLNPDAGEQYQLLANQVGGFPDAGILINASVRDLICKLNIIEKCGNGIVTASGVVLGLGLDREQSSARHRHSACGPAG